MPPPSGSPPARTRSATNLAVATMAEKSKNREEPHDDDQADHGRDPIGGHTVRIRSQFQFRHATESVTGLLGSSRGRASMTEPRRPAPAPDLDWASADARAFGEQALDIWTELLDRLHDDLPMVRNRSAAEVRAVVALEIPADPMPIDDLVAHLRKVVFDESMYPGHPCFVAYISGAGTVPGAAADLIAAVLNQVVPRSPTTRRRRPTRATGRS